MRRHYLDREIGSEDTGMENMPEGSKELVFEVEGFQCGAAQPVRRTEVDEAPCRVWVTLCAPW